MDQLPADIVRLLVTSHLSIGTAGRLSRTCQRFQTIINDEKIWRSLFEKDYTSDPWTLARTQGMSVRTILERFDIYDSSNDHADKSIALVFEKRHKHLYPCVIRSGNVTMAKQISTDIFWDSADRIIPLSIRSGNPAMLQYISRLADDDPVEQESLTDALSKLSDGLEMARTLRDCCKIKYSEFSESHQRDLMTIALRTSREYVEFFIAEGIDVVVMNDHWGGNDAIETVLRGDFSTIDSKRSLAEIIFLLTRECQLKCDGRLTFTRENKFLASYLYVCGFDTNNSNSYLHAPRKDACNEKWRDRILSQFQGYVEYVDYSSD